MRDVLDLIGSDLHAAVRGRHARRRKVRTAIAALCLALLGTIAVAGAGTVDPLALLRTLDSSTQPPTAGIQRIDLTVPVDTVRWSVISYRSRSEALCQTAAPASGQPIEAGCSAGFVIATDSQFASGLTSLAFFAAPSTARLVGGTVADDVTAVVLVDAQGARHPAPLSDRTLTIPVNVPDRHLTAEGQRVVADLPAAVTVRAFASQLPARDNAARDAPLRIELTHSNGRRSVAYGPPGSG